MANRLKEIFSDSKPQGLFTITFNSKDDSDEFNRNLSRLWEDYDFNGFEVKGINSIQRKERIDGEIYPCDESGVITKTFVGAVREEIPFDFDADGKNYHINFIRIRKSKGMILETDQSEPTSIKIIKREGMNYEISVGISPVKARCVDSIIIGVERLIAFITQTKVADEVKKDELLTNLKTALSYWQIVKSVEQNFSVSFNPSKGERNESNDLYFLYFLFVKGLPIKRQRYPFRHTLFEPNEEVLKNVEIGSLVGTYWETEMMYTIYGQDINVSYFEFAPKMKVESIKRSEDGTVEIGYIADDAEYIDVIIFYTEDINSGEVPDFNSFTKYVKKAKMLDELVDSITCK